MIESFIEGRVRLRSPLLSDRSLADCLKKHLLAVEGIRSAEVNPRTNGLLLEYDKERLPLPLLLKAAPLFDCMNALEKLPAPKRLPALEELLLELTETLR